jgi:hypothetical protein
MSVGGNGVPDFIAWPHQLFPAKAIRPNMVPFSRSGGRTIGGVSRPIRTDLGYWSVVYPEMVIHTVAQRRTWNAIRTKLSGMSGYVIVPVPSFDTAPWLDEDQGTFSVPHSDDSPFDDETEYSSPNIVVEMVDAVSIGDTSVTLRLINGAEDLVGVRFSYNHALYETGPLTEVDGDEWTVPIFPAARTAIPASAPLDFDNPTCMCHLAADNAMDVSLGLASIDNVSVSFVEAVDYWNDLAAA